MGLGGAYELRGDFKVIIWGGKPQRDRIIFQCGGVVPSRHHIKVLIL